MPISIERFRASYALPSACKVRSGSANSRIYVDEEIYSEFVPKLREAAAELSVGDPTDRSVFMGPVINRGSYKDFKDYSEELSEAGEFLTGGKVLAEGDLDKGFFVEPTIVADVKTDHRLWKHEDVPADHHGAFLSRAG